MLLEFFLALGLLLLFFFLFLLRLFLSLLLCLRLPENVEHVLVVEYRVGELVLEVVFVKQGLDAGLDLRNLQNLIDVRPLSGVLM